MGNLFNNQAEELNRIIKSDNPVVYNLLSRKGKSIYFPKDGIPAQTKEAKGTKYNATIGIALDDKRKAIRLSSIASKILLDPQDVFPYAPSFGLPELQNTWLKLIKKKNPSLRGKTSVPIVTNALTHALYILAYLFIDPGDRIITPDKFWGNYRLIFELGYGGILDTFNTFSGPSFDLSSFYKKVKDSKQKKLTIILNFPNNPTGYTPTISEGQKIILIIKKAAEVGKRILVILDDAYFGLVYKKNVMKESLFSYLTGIHKNVFVAKVDGATKEDYAWGLRVGFITYGGKEITQQTYLALENKTAGVIRGSISNVSHLSQSLVLHALNSPSYEKDKRKNYILLKSRFRMVEKTLKNKKFTRYFSPLPYNSGYFMCIKLKKGLDGEKIRQILIKKYDTGVIAIKNLLRIAYSSVTTTDIPILFDNIYKACESL